MRSKKREPKHGAAENKKIMSVDASLITDSIKNTSKKINSSINSIKNSENNKDKSYKQTLGYITLGIGAAFFLVTSVLSINFAVNSKVDTAIDTAFEALDSDLIYNGVFIEEVNISGLTKEQAIRRGNSDYAGPRLQRTFTIAYGNYSKDVTYEDLGGSYNIKSTVNEAYKLGRSGSKASRIEFTDNLERRKEYLVSSLSIDKSKMRKTLEEIAKEVEGPVLTNAEMDIDTMMETIEKSMLIGEKDIVFNIALKA